MEKSKKSLVIIAIICIVLFYVVPLICMAIPPDTSMLVLLVFLLFINPTFGFISSVVYACKYGFSSICPIMIAILFLPSVFIFYNISALIYVLVYLVVAFIGSGLSHVMYRR